MPEQYRVELFADSSVDGQQLVDLWMRETGMTLEQARARIPDVLFVGLLGDELVAINSVHLQWSPRLRLNLWQYRVFVAREHRGSGVSIEMGIRAGTFGEMMYVTGRNTEGAGVLIVVENEILKRDTNLALWNWGPNYAFIGEDDRGAHIRVHFYPDAPVPDAPTD